MKTKINHKTIIKTAWRTYWLKIEDCPVTREKYYLIDNKRDVIAITLVRDGNSATRNIKWTVKMWIYLENKDYDKYNDVVEDIKNGYREILTKGVDPIKFFTVSGSEVIWFN